MKLFEDLKRCKGDRKEYKIQPTIRLLVDNEDYSISFFPTIIWQFWIYRYPNTDGVIDIWWLHYHILIGKWVRIE